MSKTAVVFFSATGTTKGVAEKIAAATNADLVELKAAQPYTAADMNWHNDDSRCNVEMKDQSQRPALASVPSGLDQYDKIYLGFPLWWARAPRVVDTLLDQVNLGDIPVTPFCTSGSSSIAEGEQELKQLFPKVNWQAGHRFGANPSQNEINGFLK